MISIYDFGILPFALGDVLTWNVKQCVKALNAKDDVVTAYICSDDKKPYNLHQKSHVNSTNSRDFLMNLLPAFYANPMTDRMHVFNDRDQMLSILPTPEVNDHLQKIKDSETFLGVNKILFDECSSHSDINEFFKNNSLIPKLSAPKSCDSRRIDLMDRLKGKTIVALHLRARSHENHLQVTETHRDSNMSLWYEFLLSVGQSHPNVMFVLVGKNNPGWERISHLDNVVVSRLLGCTLTQELNLIDNCSFFMGSCSGFAAMAIFTDTPYIITKMDDRSCKNYGINPFDISLPFANKNQFVTHGEESFAMLNFHFNRMMIIK